MDHVKWLAWWRDRAETYFTDKSWRFSVPRVIDKLGIRQDTAVLEVGFGYGRELSQFCRLARSVHGVELSQTTVDLALAELRAQGVPELRLPKLAVYDGEVLPYPAGRFDVVYSCFVTQHLSRAHAERLLREALRVTRGSVLFEFFGDPGFNAGAMDVYSGDLADGGMYNNAYTERQVRALGGRCGRVRWVEPWRINGEWGNWWLCVEPGG